MSLDGYIAGAGGDMSWLSDLLGEADVSIEELMASIGSLLIGRTTFGGDDPNAGTDAEGAFGGMWSGPQVVLTHDPPASSDPDVTFACDLDEAVRLAKEGAGDKYVNILGANVAKQCLEAGLLDEILMFVAPVLLGDGTRVFEHEGGTNVRLRPIEPPLPVGATGHWYAVER